MNLYKSWGRCCFYIARKDSEWDGGGMSCWAPEGIEIVLRVYGLCIRVIWYYTQKQLISLAKADPELWHNCPAPKSTYDKAFAHRALDMINKNMRNLLG